MATKLQMKKLAVMSEKGVLVRGDTILLTLAQFGPMDDRSVLANLRRVDDTLTDKPRKNRKEPDLSRVRGQLYRMRRAGSATKDAEGLWAAT